MSHHYSGPNFGFPGGDPRYDFADLFAFPKPDDAGKSILIMDVHPSMAVDPPGPTTPEPLRPKLSMKSGSTPTPMRSPTSPFKSDSSGRARR